MKTLKFNPNLIPLMLSSEKYTTWRLFDDKELKVGDTVQFLEWQSNKVFSMGKLVKVRETIFRDLTDEDWEGHETFESREEMFDTYSKYYNRKVTEDTPLKIIKFKLLRD